MRFGQFSYGEIKKRTSVYVPSQWSTVICMSRKTNPYLTVPIRYDHVLDFKSFVRSLHLNLQTTTTGIKVNWLKVRWIRVEQEHPKTLFVNYTFDVENFMQINTQRTTTRTKGRVKAWPANDSEMYMCYTSWLPVHGRIQRGEVRGVRTPPCNFQNVM